MLRRSMKTGQARGADESQPIAVTMAMAENYVGIPS
jgi:hypothetical protein